MFEKLFEPVKIGPVELKNRLVMAPMAIHQYSINGVPSEQGKCYLNARAKGGVGLIICGAIMATKMSAEALGINSSDLYSAKHGPGWVFAVDSVHSFGAKIFAQMSPGFGRKSAGQHPPGVSPIPVDEDIIEAGLPEKAKGYKPFFARSGGWIHAIPRELTADEIQSEHKEYVQSCEMAIQWGFDGIEIHACHGYLIDQFLSPRANHRTDLYGGSLRNRARYLLDLLTLLKKDFGDAVPISVRISGSERVEGGNTPEDMRQVMQWCEDCGADAIHLSDGCTVERYEFEMPSVENTEPGRLIDIQGKKLKKAVKIPIITPSIHDPHNVERVLQEGETDLVSLGRPLLADPEWPNKVKAGKVDEINKCTRCQYCVGAGILSWQQIRCTVNPNAGRELYIPEYWPKEVRAKIPESLRRWKPGLSH